MSSIFLSRMLSKELVAMCLITSLTACSQPDRQTLKSATSEATKKVDALDLLVKKYEENQVLVLGFANHDNYTVYQYLNALLSRVQHDPRLKTVVIERSHDISDLYQQLSVGQTEDVIEKYPFSSEDSKQMTLCGSAEWSYSIANFLPKINDINLERANLGLSNILVKSVDSVDSRKSFFWPMSIDEAISWPGNSDKFIKENRCGLVPAREGEQPMWAYSQNREKETAQNFYRDIWQKVGQGEKLIIAYHISHTLPGFERCGLYMDSDSSWIAQRGKLTWYDYFLELDTSAESKFTRIILDENAEFYHPDGVLKVTKDIIRVDSNIGDFAVEVADISTELKGTDLFDSKVFKASANVKSKLALNQLASGIIWTSNANKRFPIKQASDYLPKYCKAETGLAGE